MPRQIITLIIDTPCWLGSHAKTLIRSFVFCRFDFFKMSFLVLLPQIVVGQKPKNLAQFEMKQKFQQQMLILKL